jgi:hypothetical protein
MADKKKTPLPKRISIENYPYTECREQHVWQPYDGVLDHKAGLAFRVQKCAHCPTRKHSVYSLRKADYGQMVHASHYSYPKDYRIAGGMDKADRGYIRMHNFLQEVEAFPDTQ